MSIDLASPSNKPFQPFAGASAGIARVHVAPRSLITGRGCRHMAGQVAHGLGERALLVTYSPGRTTAAGGPEQVREALTDADIAVTTAETSHDPDVMAVDTISAVARDADCAFVVAVGGGAVLDVGKVAAMTAVNGGSADDFHQGREPERDALPIIAIPTTIGTGSDATRVGVIRNRELGVVKSIGHPSMVPIMTILDPDLVDTLPTPLTVSGAFDALSHAIEAFISLGSDPLTDAYALQAFDLVVSGLREIAGVVTEDGNDRPDTIETLMVASHLAGAALQAGPALAHILAQPVTALTGASHAAVISAILPTTLRINQDYSAQRTRLLSHRMGSATTLAEAVSQLCGAAGADRGLRQLGVDEENIDTVIDIALRSQTHIWTNPRPVDSALLRETLLLAVRH